MQKYTYICWIHTDAMMTDAVINDAVTKMQEGRRKKTSLQLYLPLTLFVRFEKGYLRFACESVLETEHKLHILTSTTYDRHVVSFLFS